MSALFLTISLPRDTSFVMLWLWQRKKWIYGSLLLTGVNIREDHEEFLL